MADTAKRKSGSQPPISAHPAFPAIVALWFAALFGIGSLVLPSMLFERLMGAAPDFSTRLTIAAACALFGALGGLLVARKVVASQGAAKESSIRAPRAPRSGHEGPAKRPIVATEELGEEGLGPVADVNAFDDDAQKQPLPGRRRALSVTDDTGRSEYLEYVPLPGDGEIAQNDIDEPEDDSGEPEQARDDDALPLDTFAIADPANCGDRSNTAAEDDPHQADHAETLEDLRNPVEGEIDHDAAEAEKHSDDDAPAPMFAPLAADTRSQGEAGRPFDAPRAPFGNAVAVDTDAPADTIDAPAFAAPPAGDTPAGETDTLVETSLDNHADRPLAELSVSELIQRFASSLEREREQNAVAAIEPETGTGDEPAEIAEQPDEDEAAEAVAPFAFERVSVDDDPFEDADTEDADEAETAAPLFAPLAPAAMQGDSDDTAEAVDDEDAHAAVPTALRPLDLGAFEEDDQDEDDPFASSLSLGSRSAPMDRPFDAPTAVFGGPADESEAETAPVYNPFAAQAQPPAPVEAEDKSSAPFSLAAEFAQTAEDEDDDEDSHDESDSAAGYSSLLNMKRTLGSSQEFVRIEDEDEGDSEAGDAPTPEAVTFPGEAPAGTSPIGEARPFDAPPNAEQAMNGMSRHAPTIPAPQPADPAETEKALREALEKLQRMSGAA
ncbi:hypothetical protein [Erythrobacter litoralis]|uniref:Uncharacterized protein n=1 Tax=Erythrobacter litoralis (strain HTCC2594) TaxID=314225 RepID=Q2N725_ERYLH|nr:hypothetical protein [Erythrobacter litoralis]ABC64516.1 hypothetical protein ELI_12120 [Erythrobacter litoralis HTCC2594]